MNTNTSYDEEKYAYRIHAGYNSDNYSSDDKSDFDEVYEKNKPPPVLIDHSIYHVIKIQAFQDVVSKKNPRYGIYKNSPSSVQQSQNKQKPEVPHQIQQREDIVNDLSRKKNNVIRKCTLGNEQSFLAHFLDSNKYKESEKAPIKTVNESNKSGCKLKNNQTKTKARAINEAILLKHETKFPQYQDQRSQLHISSSLLNNQETNNIIDNKQRFEAKPVHTKVKNTIKFYSKLYSESRKNSRASESDRKPFLPWIADFYQTENRSTIHHNDRQHIVNDIYKAKESNFSTHASLPKSIYSSQQVHYTHRGETPVNNAWKIRCCANPRISRRINICKSQRNKYIIKRIIHEEYEIERAMAMVLLVVTLVSIFVICCNYLRSF